MTRLHRWAWAVMVAACLCGASPRAQTVAADRAEGKAETGWKLNADFSFVVTSGNSESTTLGLGATAKRRTPKSLLTLRLGALKVDTTSDLGVAIGSPDDFTVPEVNETTAETYFLAGKYNRDISEKFFWYAAAGWLRNEPAGIRNRVVGSGGLGHVWSDSEKLSFRTNYGASYTDQQDFVDVPLVRTSFAGVLLSSDLRVKFGKNKAEYANDFFFNYSLADSENWRWNMEQWISTSLTEKLSLKFTLTWLFNNVPAFKELPLLEGSPPTDMGNTVLVQLEKLDSIASMSLVVNF